MSYFGLLFVNKITERLHNYQLVSLTSFAKYVIHAIYVYALTHRYPKGEYQW